MTSGERRDGEGETRVDKDAGRRKEGCWGVLGGGGPVPVGSIICRADSRFGSQLEVRKGWDEGQDDLKPLGLLGDFISLFSGPV